MDIELNAKRVSCVNLEWDSKTPAVTAPREWRRALVIMVFAVDQVIKG
jgi:hypothetical protein